MIPTRVYVKGFLSYRDEATFDFDGAPLWMLTGRNGAGKSAVFDAIRFALYGAYRGNRREALINRQSDSLVVEFDFCIGDDEYRVKRTISRKGRSSCQAFHLPGSQSIPDTEKIADFNKWVLKIVGLDEQTFTASVMLQQGKSDALLVAEPKARHDILSQIIDLSAYQHLHKRADEEQKKFQNIADDAKDKLSGIKLVDETQIESLAADIVRMSSDLETAQHRLERQAALKVHAQSWNTLSQEQAQIRQTLDEARLLSAQAAQIERDADRLVELNRVLLLLEYIHNDQQRFNKCERQIAEYNQSAERWGQQNKEAKQKLEQAQYKLDDLKVRRQILEQQRDDAQETLDRLAPKVSEIDEIDTLQVSLQEFDQQLSVFPVDLDQQIADLQHEVDHLTEARIALSWLNEFARARKSWRDARADEDEAEAKRVEHAERWETHVRERQVLEQRLVVAKAAAGKHNTTLAKVQTLHDAASQQLDRFEKVDGQPTCVYCGQKLTPEHLENERQRLITELEAAKQRMQESEVQYKDALTVQSSLEQEAAEADGHTQQLTEEMRLIDQAARDARRDQKQAEQQAYSAFAALPKLYLALIRPSATVELAACFMGEYPTQAELTQLHDQIAQLEPLNRQLEALHVQVEERNKLRAQREPVQTNLQRAEAQYPVERAQEVRTAQQDATRRREEARQQLTVLRQPLEEAEQAYKNNQKAVEDTNEQQNLALTQAQVERGRKQELSNTISGRVDELPVTWRPVVETLTEEQLREWQEEAMTLTGADKRRKALEEAKREQKARKDRLLQIQADLEQIPIEARRPLADLEQEEIVIRQQHDTLVNTCRDAEQTKRALVARRDQRRALDTKHRKTAHQANLYKHLARLLGRDNLQRYLLHQAEVSIIANTNRVLDRVSSGTLRLELRHSLDNDDDVSGQKAFDLMAYNSDIGTEPIPVDNLSGGQRFRVAVSLALGIGQYASHGSQRIESVIIDEGFGNLDNQGRREMIDELRALKDTLSRIILVSHQTEFSDAFVSFSNQYNIVLVDGSSKLDDDSSKASLQEQL
jgi:DNA repair protein SbcC/Rad50